MQEIFVTEPIDVNIFIPLSEFLNSTVPDLEEMKKYTVEAFDPEYHADIFQEAKSRNKSRRSNTFKGLAFEAYVKWAYLNFL